MTTKEIRELLLLKEWSRDDLGERLGVCRNTIDRWFSKDKKNLRTPGVAECTLMRLWLAEARREAHQSAQVI